MKAKNMIGIYTAKQCMDLNDVEIAIEQVNAKLESAAKNNAPSKALQMRLASLHNRKKQLS